MTTGAKWHNCLIGKHRDCRGEYAVPQFAPLPGSVCYCPCHVHPSRGKEKK